MSRETVTTLRCDLCGATSKSLPVTGSRAETSSPKGWGTGEWKRWNGEHHEHLVLGLGATPDFCPDCMREIETVLIKRRQANAP